MAKFVLAKSYGLDLAEEKLSTQDTTVIS